MSPLWEPLTPLSSHCLHPMTMLGTPPRGKPTPVSAPGPQPLTPGLRAWISVSSQTPDFTFLFKGPRSPPGAPQLTGEVESGGPFPHTTCSSDSQEAPGAGSFRPGKPRPSGFVAGLLWERTAWWRRGGVRIPLLTPLRWPLLPFPTASPPAPSRHPFSLLGC